MSVFAKEKSPILEVVSSYVKMGMLGIGTILMAITVASILNHHFLVSQQAIKLLEYIGYLGWAATLGSGTVASWSRNSSVEYLDRRLSILLSMMGIFSFVLARELVPVG